MHFSNLHKILNIFLKTVQPHSLSISERKTWVLECIAVLVPEEASRINVSMGPTHKKYLQKWILILGFHYSDMSRAGRDQFQ